MKALVIGVLVIVVFMFLVGAITMANPRDFVGSIALLSLSAILILLIYGLVTS